MLLKFDKNIEGVKKELQDDAVESLDLALKGITDEDIRIIKDALSTNISLKYLNLQHNSITSAGLSILLKALPSTVRILKISGNPLGFEGGKLLAVYLRDNWSLEQLDINRCNIGEESGVNILESLEVNRRLVGININANSITKDQSPKIIRCLEKNYFLNRFILPELNLNYAIYADRNIKYTRELAEILVFNTRFIDGRDFEEFKRKAYSFPCSIWIFQRASLVGLKDVFLKEYRMSERFADNFLANLARLMSYLYVRDIMLYDIENPKFKFHVYKRILTNHFLGQPGGLDDTENYLLYLAAKDALSDPVHEWEIEFSKFNKNSYINQNLRSEEIYELGRLLSGCELRFFNRNSSELSDVINAVFSDKPYKIEKSKFYYSAASKSYTEMIPLNVTIGKISCFIKNHWQNHRIAN